MYTNKSSFLKRPYCTLVYLWNQLNYEIQHYEPEVGVVVCFTVFNVSGNDGWFSYTTYRSTKISIYNWGNITFDQGGGRGLRVSVKPLTEFDILCTRIPPSFPTKD